MLSSPSPPATVATALSRSDILQWLAEERPEPLKLLFRTADRIRREHVGDQVHLRGLIEFSNRCSRSCGYCGLRVANRGMERYCMTPDEILASARLAVQFGYGSVVLQSGEDHAITRGWVKALISRIRQETGLAITLSLGERHRDDLAAWKEAGADRYLLRFETSNETLFNRIHPPLPGPSGSRMALLATLHGLGYEVGSGIMVGIPGQSFEDLANDIETFRTLDLDMIGIGPFLPHPATPLGTRSSPAAAAAGAQVPNTGLMTCKTLALARMVCPDANIPSTTALATLQPDSGREQGLLCGANVIMPNLTPHRYRRLYEIYPDKACCGEEPLLCQQQLQELFRKIGRIPGSGRGDSPNLERRRAAVQTAA